MKRFFSLLLIVTIFSYSCASTGGQRIPDSENSENGSGISARGAIGEIEITDDLWFEGDSGSDIRLAVLAPEIQGEVPGYLPLYAQGLLNNNFRKYSAITLIDRQNLDRIVAEQNIAAGGYYSDRDFVTIGNLTNTQYFLFGIIQRLSGGRYSLQFSVTDSNTGIRRAHSVKEGTLAQLTTGALINDASADILGQLGVRLTESGRRALLAGNAAAAQAESNLARGIIAQAGGSEVAALLNFSQSAVFDPSQMEAISRLDDLSSAIGGGSLTEKIVSDIQARNQWLETFKETARFFDDHPPFEIIFDPNLVQIGETNYERNTADLGMRIALNSTAGFDALNTILRGLDSTGKRSIWGFDGWPLRNISPRDRETLVFGGRRSFSYRVETALYNEAGKTLGRSTITLNSGTISYSARDRIVGSIGDYKTVLFSNISAEDLTPTLTIEIVSVNGVPTQDVIASGSMNIDTGNLEGKEGIVRASKAKEGRKRKEIAGTIAMWGVTGGFMIIAFLLMM